MQLEKLYRVFLAFKTISELAYLLGYWIGRKRKKK